MAGPRVLDEITQQLAGLLPPGMQSMRDDMERTIRSVLQSQLHKLDLVTREEFAVQAAVLQKTRAKVDALEKALAKLENAG